MPLPLLIPIAVAAGASSFTPFAVGTGFGVLAGIFGGFWYGTRGKNESEEDRKTQKAQYEMLVELMKSTGNKVDSVHNTLHMTGEKFDGAAGKISNAIDVLQTAMSELKESGVVLAGTTQELKEIKNALSSRINELKLAKESFERIENLLEEFASFSKTKHADLIKALEDVKTFKQEVENKLTEIKQLEELIVKFEKENTHLKKSNESKQKKIESLEPKLEGLLLKFGLYAKSAQKKDSTGEASTPTEKHTGSKTPTC